MNCKQTQGRKLIALLKRKSMTVDGSHATRFRQEHGYASPINGKRDATYTCWRTMRQRCYYQRHKSYPSYGGRGIAVCEEWSDFSRFLADMGQRPRGMTLGRIDNDGNYSPSNCRWETHKQQARNRRSSRMISAFGKTQPLAAWAEQFTIKADTLMYRIRGGMRVEDALSTPVKQHRVRG